MSVLALIAISPLPTSSPVYNGPLWGWVIFLHLFVILFTEGGYLVPGDLLTGGACSRWGVCSGGVPAPGVPPSWGCLFLGGACSRGVPGGDPPDGYCCGRYASYWNAFSFFLHAHFSHTDCVQNCSFKNLLKLK